MTKFPLLFATAAALLLAPVVSQAQFARGGGGRLGAFSGGGDGRNAAIASAPAARGNFGGTNFGNRGYRGNFGRSGYYGGNRNYSRYYHRGGYYYYDPFFYGGFGYPYYYGTGLGIGFSGPFGYYDGYGPYAYDRVYNGRIVEETGPGRRGDGDREDGRYAPGSMAREVQRELKERGYYKGSVDGQFGEGTRRALRAFQGSKGLSVTGRLDERTLAALGFERR